MPFFRMMAAISREYLCPILCFLAAAVVFWGLTGAVYQRACSMAWLAFQLVEPAFGRLISILGPAYLIFAGVLYWAYAAVVFAAVGWGAVQLLDVLAPLPRELLDAVGRVLGPALSYAAVISFGVLVLVVMALIELYNAVLYLYVIRVPPHYRIPQRRPQP